MKQGIHLGHTSRGSRFLRSLLWLAILGTIFHWALLVRARSELESAEEAEASSVATSEAEALSEMQLSHLWELDVVVGSGVLDSLSITRVLHAVDKALPESVSLISLSLKPTPPQPTLLLEAWARDAKAVARLEQAMVRSEGVLVTRLLEERPARDGGLSIRLQVDLALAATRDPASEAASPSVAEVAR